MSNVDSLVGRVEAFIKKESLISKKGLHLVALSGGADSVALLRILLDLGYDIEAAHCNFHLRGEESNRDELFVKNLCQRLDIKLHLIHFDTTEYAALHQVSIEMAARDLRYGYFSQLLKDIGASTVCVAHHRDDAVETLLMNLLRGSGIHGLTGIRPHNGHIVRPLLCVSRQEIEDYLRSIGQDNVTDSTNLQPDVLRNKVRLQLLPLLEQLNPGASDNIARSAYYISEAEKVYNSAFSPLGATLPLLELKEFPSPLCLLYEWLSPYKEFQMIKEREMQEEEANQRQRNNFGAQVTTAVSLLNRIMSQFNDDPDTQVKINQLKALAERGTITEIAKRLQRIAKVLQRPGGKATMSLEEAKAEIKAMANKYNAYYRDTQHAEEESDATIILSESFK